MDLSDTIVAIATAVGQAGLGVVRLSGSQSKPIIEKIVRFAQPVHWQSWANQFGYLIDQDGQSLDQVVVAFFGAPRSYTAEDVVELTCHGSPVVLHACVRRAIEEGARLAEPGEFTLRAYLNGRIDLPQAEAVRDLIEATTLYQARVAVQQVEGSTSRRIRPAKEALLQLISLLEAGIDFAEDDVDVASNADILERIDDIHQQVDHLVNSFATGRLVFEGFTLAIVGRPNVGKSSLFNRLLAQDRAIVTDIPGTTRDVISESTTLGGLPMKLVDTAGVRKGQGLVESLGIERSYQAMADADLTLLVLDVSEPLQEEDQALLEKLSSAAPLIVGNKRDLPRQLPGLADILTVSSTTGAGIEELRAAILGRLAPEGLATPESGSLTNIRHEALLRESADALHNARRAVEYGIPHEMLLLDLYAALAPIDAVTGATTADDILNRIFATFCIGK